MTTRYLRSILFLILFSISGFGKPEGDGDKEPAGGAGTHPAPICPETAMPAPDSEAVTRLKASLDPVMAAIPCGEDEYNATSQLITAFRKPTLTDKQWEMADVLAFIQRKYPGTPKCVNKEFFADFLKLYQSAKIMGWDVKLIEINNLIIHIKEHWNAWKTEAESLDKSIKKDFNLFADKPDSRVEIIVKPNGELIISYKNALLGKGSFKEAHTRVGLAVSEGKIHEIKDLASISPLRADGVSEIEKEIGVYQRIHEEKARLAREGLHLTGLMEADIVELTEGKRSVVQQRFDGDFAKNRRLLNGERGNSILHKMSEGLAHFHGMGLVHSDIKEANIMYKEDGATVAITDYGLSYDPRVKIAAEGGTPDYLSPEAFTERFPHSSSDAAMISRLQSRDIYALGLIAVKSIPAFSAVFPHERVCKSYFSGNFRDPTYVLCRQQVAQKLHDDFRIHAETACRGKEPRSCKEMIILDCLNPDPTGRPTARNLENRFREVLTHDEARAQNVPITNYGPLKGSGFLTTAGIALINSDVK